MSENYLELHLPSYLVESIDLFVEGRTKRALDKGYLHFDCDYALLQANINCAEVDNEISSEQAWHLREKYLGLSRKELTGNYA